MIQIPFPILSLNYIILRSIFYPIYGMSLKLPKLLFTFPLRDHSKSISCIIVILLLHQQNSVEKFELKIGISIELVQEN